MADFEFTFHGEPRRYQDIVQRLAVLYPLRKRRKELNVTFETIQLQQQWRARIGNLTTNGWLSGNTSHSILYARNCMPTFAMAKPKVRSCRNTAICPFCYARWVREVWRCIDGNFPAPDPIELTDEEKELGREFRNIVLDDEDQSATRRRPEFKFHLIYRTSDPMRPVVADGTPSVEETLTGLFQNITAIRAEFVKSVDPAGAFLYTTIEPNEDGTQWAIRNRQLFKIAADVPTPERLTRRGKVQRIERPTRKVLCRFVAQACRYPIGLLTGDPERTVQLLDIKKAMKFRAHERYRGFRRKKY